MEKRGICAEKRNAIPDEKEMFDQMDLLPIWSEFVPMIRESDIVKNNGLCVAFEPSNNFINLIQYNDDDDIIFSIRIYSDFSTKAIRSNTKIDINHLNGIAQRVNRWSQIEEIINRCKHQKVKLQDEINSFVSKIRQTIHTNAYADTKHDIDFQRLEFIIDQLHHFDNVKAKKYSASVIKVSTELLLCGRMT